MRSEIALYVLPAPISAPSIVSTSFRIRGQHSGEERGDVGSRGPVEGVTALWKGQHATPVGPGTWLRPFLSGPPANRTGPTMKACSFRSSSLDTHRIQRKLSVWQEWHCESLRFQSACRGWQAMACPHSTVITTCILQALRIQCPALASAEAVNVKDQANGCCKPCSGGTQA